MGRKTLPAGLAVATEIAAIPVAILSGYALVHRGPPVRILAGEVGGVRLTQPLVLPAPGRCESATAHRDLVELPALPRFVPRPENHKGTLLGDPLNLPLARS